MPKVIALVPARGGSKSIPFKNIKSFCGKPLIYWTLSALSKGTGIDRVILATDSEDIAQTARGFNLAKVEVYNRKPENATDTASTESVMLEVIEELKLSSADNMMLVQATSPFLTTENVDGALALYQSKQYDSVLSCVRMKRFLWSENGESMNYNYKARPRRQDFAGMLMENGALYVSNIQKITENANRLSGKIGIYEMPEFTATEIDEEDDWIVSEALMRKHILTAPSKGKIKLFATDVDGVLTDAGMYYSEQGDELKKFNTLDGKGIELLRNAGIKTAILTSENTAIVERRAQKLKMDFLFQGQHNKLETLKGICSQLGISLSEVAYIGDDINDEAVLNQVGYAACPLNAVATIKQVPGIIQIPVKGGDGAVRAFVEYLFSEKAV